MLSLLIMLLLPISAQAAAKTEIDASQKDRWTNGLVGYWTFDGADMAGGATSAGGNLLRESFEGTGYENSDPPAADWSQYVQSSN